jgi:hypothetical protein
MVEDYLNIMIGKNTEDNEIVDYLKDLETIKNI